MWYERSYSGTRSFTLTKLRELAPYLRILWPALLFFPLLLGIIWGPNFEDGSYVNLRYAQNLASGPGLTYRTAVGYFAPPLTAPLYATALALPARAGLDLVSTALVLSTLGWVGAGLAIYFVGKRWGQPPGALLTLVLLVFNPTILTTLGSEQSWGVMFGWLVLALAPTATQEKDRHMWLSLAVLLLLTTEPAAYNIVLALMIAMIQWWQAKRIPWSTVAATALGLFIWGVISGWQPGSLLPVENRPFWGQLVAENELYWLLFPLAGLGLWSLFRDRFSPTLWAGLIWATVAAVSGNAAITMAMALFLVGMGANWIVERITASATTHTSQLTGIVLLAIALSLGSAQATSLWVRYRARPLGHWQLERQIAAWLRTNTPSQATIFSSERVGYLAQRPTVSQLTSQDEVSATPLLDKLREAPLDYLVILDGIVWHNLKQMIWFRLSYEVQREFTAAYDVASPATVWSYRAPLPDKGERATLNARVPDRFSLIGYQIGPERIQPGDEIHLVLYLQAARATTVEQSAFQAIVRLVSAADGSTRAEWNRSLPRSVDVAQWRPDGVIVEQLTLPTTTDLEPGAYRLNLSFHGPDSATLWPFSLDNDINQLDRVPLDYVIVPWQGSLDGVARVQATFAQQISLEGFETTAAQPGQPLEVTLYWQAQRPPDSNYVVFVHLLDANDQLVASHDGPPANGRYPTETWLPGDIIPDTHSLQLPEDLPPGSYRLQAGLYRPQSGQRLPAQTATGATGNEGSVLLGEINVP